MSRKPIILAIGCLIGFFGLIYGVLFKLESDEQERYTAPRHKANCTNRTPIGHTDAPENAFLLSPDKAGFVGIWANAGDVISKYGKSIAKLESLELEGESQPAINVYLIQNDTTTPSLTCELQGENVDRIFIYDSRFKTAQGIGIGATLGMLRKEYKVDWIGQGDGSVIARVDSIGTSFGLNGDLPEEFYRNKDMTSIPDETPIKEIFLTGRTGISYDGSSPCVEDKRVIDYREPKKRFIDLHFLAGIL